MDMPTGFLTRTLDPLSHRGELARQASVMRDLGSPFVALVLEAGQRNLARAPRTAALIETWPGDPSAAALALRFNSALHALARRGRPRRLRALYRRRHDDFDDAVGTAMAQDDAFIAQWMRSPTQTNEVARAGAIVGALMVAKHKFGLPFELLELGSSAGLNLNLERYRYDLGGLLTGDLASSVRVAPTWRGAAPRPGSLQIVGARGVDLHPLDVGHAATRERLLSYVFADQPQRLHRLGEALAIARRHPVRIDQADAVAWLEARLQEPQAANVCRTVFHSMVLQYLSPADRAAVHAQLAAAGRAATMERPLAWISFEWTPDRHAVELRLTAWPTGESALLATCHPYCAWIHWHG